MIDPKLIERINHLAHKENLTQAEKEEQAKLRKEYVRQFKEGFRQTLDNVKVVDEEGNDITPKKKGKA